MAAKDKDRNDEFVEEVEKAPAAEPAKPTSKKWRNIMFGAFLLMGALIGLHLAGIIDIRPFAWTVIPKIPFVGDTLKKNLDIPEIYTMTVEERRKLELEQWQQRLDKLERETKEKSSQADAASSDLAARTQQVRAQEEQIKKQEETKPKEGPSDDEKAVMDELIRTYQEVSPRRAALIIARLREDLAVDLLTKLPQDARASILSKLDPKKAAAITERIANSKN